MERKKKDLRICKVKRLEIYNQILELGYLKDCGVCHEDQDKLMKALDAAVILMEGGSEFDLTILDGRTGDKPLIAIPVAKLKKEQPKVRYLISGKLPLTKLSILVTKTTAAKMNSHLVIIECGYKY